MGWKVRCIPTCVGDDGVKRSRWPLASTDGDMASTGRAEDVAVDIVVDDSESCICDVDEERGSGGEGKSKEVDTGR